MRGKIVKGIAGFYYIWCEDENLYECKAKGSFRKEGVKPLVGDNVDVQVLDQEKKLGNMQGNIFRNIFQIKRSITI